MKLIKPWDRLHNGNKANGNTEWTAAPASTGVLKKENENTAL